MGTKKSIQMLAFVCIFILASTTLVLAASTNPSKPTSITENTNTTSAYPMGEMLNNTRGYIYNITINESQPSRKWIGYVGNINGEYALQDASGNALYDWDIATITGEIYATKETSGGGFEDSNPYGGGIPDWTNLTCAVNEHISEEGSEFNHTASDEDSYSNTFKADTFTLTTFYAGERQVTDSSMWRGEAENCFGINLNKNNADEAEGGDWEEVVLTDGTYQYRDSTETDKRFDIVYAVLLENNTVGFDGNEYDFQMLLPQSGLQGTQDNVPFYFYTELI